ncbi:unnamed protein product [Parnassius mnemosyne]|uniref:RNA-directed DNA polymerase n=1 Tax=Parnassius mnemosyne TaxID=213953 RepID=A0AAV1L899_9NEOP
MTEARLQRYALFLAAYNYKIEFINSESNVADYLSQFPIDCDSSQDTANVNDVTSYVNALTAAGAPLPASLDELRAAFHKDKVLSLVMQYVTKSWLRIVSSELLPYNRCQYDVDSGVLMRGHRIVVPTVYKAAVLQELHAAHLRVIKMKMIARERCWYPGIDSDIENMASNCSRCISLRPSPAKARLESWGWPDSVFERIHLDYLGPIHGKIFLVLVDAHSKWIECELMSNFLSKALISKLKKNSRFGIPNKIVTDNAKTFVSSEFSKYCTDNEITHILSPAYSPQSNGLAENTVKTCKRFIVSAVKDCGFKDFPNHLDNYLFHYRNTPHCTTGVSPTSLMFGRNLRCKLDLIAVKRSNSDQKSLINKNVLVNKNRQKLCFSGKIKAFSIGEKVWVRDCRANPKRPT